jgi:hypothetical protein
MGAEVNTIREKLTSCLKKQMRGVVLTVVEDPVHVTFLCLHLDGESTRITGATRHNEDQSL